MVSSKLVFKKGEHMVSVHINSNAMRLKHTVVLLVGVFASFSAFAQNTLNKEVQVVRTYEPVLSDAFKINQLPTISDTVKIVPHLSYSIIPKIANTQFRVSPIPAAKLIGEPISAITPYYVRLGFGTTLSPLIEAYYGSLRQDDLSYGGFLRHFSSAGKVKLDNGKKERVLESENEAGFYGKKIFNTSAFEGGVLYKRNRFTFYGADPLYTGDIKGDSLKQVYHRLGVDLSLHSLYTDSTHFNYAGRVGYTYFGDKFSMTENNLDILVSGNKFFESQRIGGDIEIIHIAKSSELSSNPNSIFRISPWMGVFGTDWRAKAGVNMVSDSWGGKSDVFIYPIGELSYDVISHYFIPYINIGGKLAVNSYEKIMAENPYVMPGLNVRNTNHKFIFEAGLKGKFSSSVSFNVAGSYSLSDSLYFFVNNFAENPSQFGVVYDNAQVTHFFGELVVGIQQNFSLMGRGEVTRYALDKLAKPWQKPGWEITVSALGNFKEKLYVKGSLVASGDRYALSESGDAVKMSPYVDLSLGFEYRMSKSFSLFLDFNNILGESYYQWYRYSTYGFNALAGVTLSF